MQLSKQSEDPSLQSAVFAVFDAGEAAGVLTVREGTHHPLTVTVEWATLGTRAATVEFVAAIDGLAREHAATSLQIDTVDELVRYVARAEGFTGGLREPLVRDETQSSGTTPQPFAEIDSAILDVAVSVLRRFPVEIHRISCEEASYDLATGQHAGETYPNVGMVYLNARRKRRCSCSGGADPRIPHRSSSASEK